MCISTVVSVVLAFLIGVAQHVYPLRVYVNLLDSLRVSPIRLELRLFRWIYLLDRNLILVTYSRSVLFSSYLYYRTNIKTLVELNENNFDLRGCCYPNCWPFSFYVSLSSWNSPFPLGERECYRVLALMIAAQYPDDCQLIRSEH